MELSAEKDVNEVNIDGKEFHVFTIRKAQIIPLQEGTLQLGEAYVDNVVQLLHADGLRAESYSATLWNKPLFIEVKNLPPTNKPKNFSNIVGKFSIEAKVDTTSAAVGENVTLSVTIKGSGNIAGINMPTIQWPKGTEHFEGSDTQMIEQESFPATGYKIFLIPFISNSEGSIVIPPISFSYFDVSAGKYRTVESNSIPVTFTKALSRDEQMKQIVTEEVSNKKYLWIVGAIAAAVILAGINSVARDKKKQKEKILQQKEDPSILKEYPIVVKDDASEIFSALNDLGAITGEKDFLSKTRVFLTYALQVKLSAINAGEHELIQILKKDNEYVVASSCERIYEICNRNLYSPEADENVQEQIYFEVTSVVRMIYNFS
jgi:hypothetical protein